MFLSVAALAELRQGMERLAWGMLQEVGFLAARGAFPTPHPSSIDETKCDFPRLLRIVPGDALMHLRPKWCDVTSCHREPQVCGQQKRVRPAADRAKCDGRFPDRWWQVWWQRRGIKGTRGDLPVSSFSNLLIMLVTIAVLIPPFGGSNPSTPAKLCRTRLAPFFPDRTSAWRFRFVSRWCECERA